MSETGQKMPPVHRVGRTTFTFDWAEGEGFSACLIYAPVTLKCPLCNVDVPPKTVHSCNK